MTKNSSSKDFRQSSTSSQTLVSIICRSVNRPELKQALRSLTLQTHPNIEIVLVDALGQGIPSAVDICKGRQLELVSTGERLDRSAAANAGLERAQGDFLMFLDDDDWIAEDHIATLLKLLLENSGSQAAYSATRKVSNEGKDLDHVFDQEFRLAQLRRDNFIPIHAVLFKASLVTDGCKFDPDLAIYEDWDFWLQVAERTTFLHHDKITAFYREGGDSDTAVNEELLKYSKGHPNAVAREKVLNKWLPKWSASDINEMFGTMDQSAAVMELRAEAKAAQEVIRARESEVTSITDTLKSTGKQLGELHRAHDALVEEHQSLAEHNRLLDQAQLALHGQLHELQVQHEELDAGVREILGSFSWRITKPYRYLSHRIRKYILSPILGPVKKNTIKVVLKNPALHQLVRDVKTKIPTGSQNAKIYDRLHYGLDSPSTDNRVFSNALTIRGWAMTEKSPVELSLFVNELEFRVLVPDLPRPDVSDVFPWLDHAGMCGFSIELPLGFLASGIHSLTLVARTPQGFSEEIHREFYLLGQQQLYKAWRNYKTINDYGNATGLIGASANLCAHIVFTESDDPQLNLASLVSIARQDCDNWQVHFIGESWQELQTTLATDVSEIFKLKLTVANNLTAVCSKLNQASDYLLGLHGGECLQAGALSELLTTISESGSGNENGIRSIAVYSDHDSIDSDGEYTDPVFTFGWSPDHLMARNYVADVFLFEASLFTEDFCSTAQLESWRFAMLLQLAATGKPVDRVAKMLWSQKANTDDDSVRIATEASLIEKSLAAQGKTVSISTQHGQHYLDWALAQQSKVAIIIPTMGKLELIRPCLDSLVQKTNYENFEIIMLDNSRGKYPEGIAYLHEKNFQVIECDEAFNWARLNNIGASHTTAEHLLFLNDDIEVIDEDWLLHMVKLAQRPEVGSVGGLLLYPNGAMQHAGVFIVNTGGGCAHLFHKMMPNENIYRRLDRTVREVTANTGACLMVPREKFEAIGGFDEELAIVGNDIDLCLRLADKGFRNVWTPQCRLIHHESISRKSSIPKADEKAMWDRWESRFVAGDVFYNSNLTLEKWDCSLHIDVPAEKLVGDLNLRAMNKQEAGLITPLTGVNLIAYIRAEMGVGEGARSDARALAASGTEFGIINFETANPARMTDLSWQHKEMLSAPFDINLIHINADYLPLAKQEIPAHFFQGRYNIAYWAWELEEIPKQWLNVFKEVDEVWVPSEFVKAAVEKQSPVPVVTIPHCVDLQLEQQHSREHFGLRENTFCFLAMFDSRSIAERKNPYGAIRAFKQAFDGNNESVSLILKVNNAEDENMTTLMSEIESHPNIMVMDGTHSRAEINSLIALCDCFVSLHRSEGFGLGPAEAMCLGKATILTDWSGSTDYMTTNNCMPIDYELVRIEKTLGPYEAGQRWAEPDLDQAADAMKTLFADAALTKSIGDNAQAYINKHFSPAAVGKRAKQRLDEIRTLARL